MPTTGTMMMVTIMRTVIAIGQNIPAAPAANRNTRMRFMMTLDFRTIHVMTTIINLSNQYCHIQYKQNMFCDMSVFTRICIKEYNNKRSNPKMYIVE